MTEETYFCEHCGAEADLTVEGFERVEDVIKRGEKLTCKACGKEMSMGGRTKEVYACQHCRAEADMTLEGFENVADVIQREKHLTCRSCGRPIDWTAEEEVKALRVAMEAERSASQAYARAAKATKDPRGRDMFEQLSEFERNHLQKLKDQLKSLEEKGQWSIYSGTSLKKPRALKAPKPPKGEDQLNDMEALKIAIREEKKAQGYYRSMAELTRDPRGKEMYKRLAEEEALHEKLLNDQYYSLHNTGLWSWGD